MSNKKTRKVGPWVTNKYFFQLLLFVNHNDFSQNGGLPAKKRFYTTDLNPITG